MRYKLLRIDEMSAVIRQLLTGIPDPEKKKPQKNNHKNKKNVSYDGIGTKTRIITGRFAIAD